MKTISIVSTGHMHGMHVSQITLESGESTPKHYHQKTTEVYAVTSGIGMICCGDSKDFVEVGSVVVIPPRAVHQIINTGDADLVVISSKDTPRQFKDDFPV